MPPIVITVYGVEELLRDLNIHQFSGPDALLSSAETVAHCYQPILEYAFSKLNKIWYPSFHMEDG